MLRTLRTQQNHKQSKPATEHATVFVAWQVPLAIGVEGLAGARNMGFCPIGRGGCTDSYVNLLFVVQLLVWVCTLPVLIAAGKAVAGKDVGVDVPTEVLWPLLLLVLRQVVIAVRYGFIPEVELRTRRRIRRCGPDGAAANSLGLQLIAALQSALAFQSTHAGRCPSGLYRALSHSKGAARLQGGLVPAGRAPGQLGGKPLGAVAAGAPPEAARRHCLFAAPASHFTRRVNRKREEGVSRLEAHRRLMPGIDRGVCSPANDLSVLSSTSLTPLTTAPPPGSPPLCSSTPAPRPSRAEPSCRCTYY